jgi:hypothetical protein
VIAADNALSKRTASYAKLREFGTRAAVSSRTRENGIEPNKQLEAAGGERLDTGTASTAIARHTTLAAVGARDGAEDGRR